MARKTFEEILKETNKQSSFESIMGERKSFNDIVAPIQKKQKKDYQSVTDQIRERNRQQELMGAVNMITAKSKTQEDLNRLPEGAFDYIEANKKESKFVDFATKLTKNDSRFDKVNNVMNAAKSNVSELLQDKYKMDKDTADYYENNWNTISANKKAADFEKEQNDAISKMDKKEYELLKTYSTSKDLLTKTTNSSIQQEQLKARADAREQLKTNYGLSESDIEKLADYVARDNNKNYNKKLEAEAQETAKTGVGRAVLRGEALALAPIAGITSTIDTATEKITGRPIDLYSSNKMLSNTQHYAETAVSEAVGEKYSEKYGEKIGQTVQFLNDTLMSVGESAETMILGSNVANFLGLSGTTAEIAAKLASYPLFSSGAFAATLRDKMESGQNEDQAFNYAIATGIAEGLFEELSFDRLQKLAHATGKVGKLQFIKNLLKQGLYEGSEEINTDIANTITDALINADYSDLQLKRDNYMLNGYSEEEANSLALKDFGMQLLESGLAGAISGILMGTGASVVQHHNYKKMGSAATQKTLEKAVDVAMNSDIASESTAREIAQRLSDEGRTVDSLSEKEKTQLFESLGSLQADEIDLAINNALEEQLDNPTTIEKAKALFEEYRTSNMTDEQFETKLVNEVARNSQDRNTILSIRDKAFSFDTESTPITAAVNEARIDRQIDLENKAIEKEVARQDKKANKQYAKFESAVTSKEKYEAAKGVAAVSVKEGKELTETKVLRIDSLIGGANTTLIAEGGRKVMLKNLTFKDENMGKLYNEVVNTMINKQVANKALENYKGQPVETYVKAYNVVYELGRQAARTNKDASWLLNNTKDSYIVSNMGGASVASEVFYLGKNDAEHYKSVRERIKGKPENKTYQNKSNAEEIRNSESEIKDLLAAISEKTGVKISELNAIKDNDGNYNTALLGSFVDNVITLNKEGKNEIQTLLHEVMEKMKSENQEGYNLIVSEIIDYVQSTKGSEALVDNLKKYQSSYAVVEGISATEEIADEYANDFVSGILTSPEGLVDLARWASKEDPKKAKNLLKAIEELFNRILDAISTYMKAHSAKMNLGTKEGFEATGKRIEALRKTVLAELDKMGKNNNTDNNASSDSKYSVDVESSYAPTFYSKMENEIAAIKTDKIGAASLIPYLKGKGVKDEEIKWSGLSTFLENKKSISKEEVLNFVKENQIQIEEKTLYDVSFDRKSEFDAIAKEIDFWGRYYDYKDEIEFDYAAFNRDVEGYREEEENADMYADKLQQLIDLAAAEESSSDAKYMEYAVTENDNYREILFKLADSDYSNRAMNNHWGESGVIAHARIDDAVTNNKKMLFIEEIQSDWQNEGNKKGFFENLAKMNEGRRLADEIKHSYENLQKEFLNNTEIKKLNDKFRSHKSSSLTPFDSLALGYLYGQMEIQEGYTSFHPSYSKNFTITKAEADALRAYRKQLLELNKKYDGVEEKTYDVPDVPFRNGKYIEYVMKRLLRLAAEEGYDSIGWTSGKMQEERWSNEYAEGYRIEYDQDIPKFLSKYGKQWGMIVTREGDIWKADITDAMKQSVLHEGQARFSVSVDSEKMINESMTMEDARKMIGKALKISGNKDYTDADEWLKNEGVDEVAMWIENDYTLQENFLNRIPAYIDGDITVTEIVDAYANGTLTGKVKTKSDRSSLKKLVSKDVVVSDKRFYAPQKIEEAKAIYNTATQRLTKANEKEVSTARAKILLYAHNKNAAQTLGITESELNKKLRQWSNYSITAKNISLRINEAAADANRWTGIENVSWISQYAVTSEEVERMVNKIEGRASDREKSYIARTMLSFDTHIDWSWLNFTFKSAQEINDDKTNKKVNGYYNDSNRVVTVKEGYKHTVAHEMTHALDYQWGRDFGRGVAITNIVTAPGWEKEYEGDSLLFLEEFNDFVDSIRDSSDDRSTYTNDIRETFARFGSKFVAWTNSIATGRTDFEIDGYQDKFTQAQFLHFARILQMKSALDNNKVLESKKNYSVDVDSESDDIRYSVNVNGEEYDYLGDILGLEGHAQLMSEVSTYPEEHFEKAANGDLIIPINNMFVYTKVENLDVGISAIIVLNTQDGTRIANAGILINKYMEKGVLTYDQVRRIIERFTGKGSIRKFTNRDFGSDRRYDWQRERGQSRSDSYHLEKQQNRKDIHFGNEKTKNLLRYKTDKQIDKLYFNAISNNNLDLAKEIVKEYAKKQGYKKEVYVSNNSDSVADIEDLIIYATDDEASTQEDFSTYFVNTKSFYTIDAKNKDIDSLYLPSMLLNYGKQLGKYKLNVFNNYSISELAEIFRLTKDYPGLVVKNVNDKGFTKNYYLVFDKSRLKLADTLTYDNNGDIIHLSERFDSNEDDVRFSIDVDSEGNKLSEQQIEFFKDSKGRDQKGNLKVFYHGTRENNLNVFDMSFLGTGSGDTGYFGKGFYFAFTEAEAKFYGKNIIKAYLNTKNPYYFNENLSTYNGKRSSNIGSEAIFAVNFEKQFPDIAKEFVIDAWDKEGNYVPLSFKQFAKEFEDVYNNKVFKVRREVDEYTNEDTFYVTTDEKEMTDIQDNGKVDIWYEYGYEAEFFDEKDASDQAYNAANYLNQTKYWGIKIPNAATMIMDSEFAEELKKRGYDSIYQSAKGDEVVVFEPNQIKRIDNKAPTQNVDIRYQVDVDDDLSIFEAIIAENEEIEKASSVIKNTVKNMDNLKIKDADIKKIATSIKTGWKTNASVEDITDSLTSVFAYLNQDNVNYDALVQIMSEIAKPILENATETSSTRSEHWDKFREYLSKTKFSLSPKQVREVVSEFGSTENYRKRLFGVTTVSKDALPLDEIWSELVDASGNTLPVSVTDTNQPAILLQIIDGLRPQAITKDTYAMNLEEASYDLALEIYRKYFEAVAKSNNNTEIAQAIGKVKAQQMQLRRKSIERYQKKLEEQKKLLAAEKAKNIKALAKEIQKSDLDLQAALAENDEVSAAIIQDLKNKNEKKLEQVRKQRDDQISKIKAKNFDARLAERDRRKNTALKEQLRNQINSLNKMLKSPNTAAFIKPTMVMGTIEVLEAINLDTGKSQGMREKLSKLAELYAKYAGDKTFNFDYDESTAQMIAELRDMFEGRNYTELSNDELQKVVELVIRLKTQIQNASKLLQNEKYQNAADAAMDVVSEVNAAKGSMDKSWTKLFDKYFSYQLNAYRWFRKTSGYKDDGALMNIYEQLDKGQMKMIQMQKEINDMFASLLEGKENQEHIKRLTSIDEKDMVDIGLKVDGKPFKVTRGMLLSYLMHIQNEQNARHLVIGGFTLPDMKLYKEGKYTDAFEKTIIGEFFTYQDLKDSADSLKQNKKEASFEDGITNAIKVLQARSKKLRSSLSEWELSYLETAEKLFHEYYGEKINEVSVETRGYALASTKNYFPIKTDKKFTRTEFAALKQDGTLEGLGFLKERIKASNPIMLEDISNVILRQTDNTSRYYGFSVPVRNVNMVMNMKFNNRTSPEAAISDKWGSYNLGLFQKILQDVQTGRGADEELASFFNRLRGNFAGATLTANIGVAMKQAASYPTAAAVLGRDPLLKAFKNFSFNKDKGIKELEGINPLLWYRSKGQSSADISYAKQSDIYKKLEQKYPMFKAISVDLIQNVDSATVRTLEYASMYYVDDNFKDLKKGSEEYWQKVSEIFTKVVEETQPNYTVLQRPEALKTKDQIAKQLFMFKTQPLQNFGILYDAIGEYSTAKKKYAKNSPEFKKSVEKLSNAIISQLTAAAVFSAMTILANIVYHKHYKYRQDDDKSFLEEMLIGFASGVTSTIASVLLGGDYLYQAISEKLFGTKNYGIEISIIEMFNDLNDIVNNVQKNSAALADAKTEADRMTALKKLGQNADDAAVLFGEYFGFPVNNVKNTIGGIWLPIKDLLTGQAWGDSQFIIDESVDSQYVRMFDAIISNDIERYNKLKAEQLKASKANDPEKSINSKMKKMIEESYLNQEITADEAMEYFLRAGIKYDTYVIMNEAISNAYNNNADRSAIIEEINKLLKSGVDKSSIASNITSIYKPIYLENKKADLKNLLIVCYMACGYTREEAIKKIDSWK